MKPMKKAFPGVAFLALTACLTGCEQPIEEEEVVRPVKTIVVTDSGLAASRTFPGTVRAAKRAQLSFRVSGPLVSLPVYEGQSVRKGALLARIDARDFETAVNNLEARLADLKAQYRGMQVARPEEIRRLEATLGASKARLVEAEAAFRRYQRLYENDNISKAEYDQRRAAREVAESDVRTSEEALEIARSGARPEDLEAMEARIRAMESDLLKAKDLLNDTELRAPYDGVVAETYVENFEFVSAQAPILSLQDLTTVEIVAQIPESIVSRARRGQDVSAKARFDSLPGREVEARPTEFSTEADPVTRTYAVTFQCPQPEEVQIFAGMTAEIEITGSPGSNPGSVVPIAAVFGDENGNQNVWVLEKASNTLKKVQVQVGQPSGDGILILSGLASGDSVVTAGAQFVSEGQVVRPIVDELRDRR